MQNISRFIQNSLITTILFVTLLSLSSTIFSGFSSLLLISILVVLILTALKPNLALCLLLIFLPLGGNRPGTEHFYFTVMYAFAVLFGLVINNKIKHKTFLPYNINFSLITFPTFFAGLYLVASICSLTSIPISIAIREASTYLDFKNIFSLLSTFHNFFLINEHSLIYPYLSVLLTTQAFLISLYAFSLCTVDNKNPFRFCSSIAVGLILSLIVGVLDYYQFIDLRSFRGLDPIVNPGDQQFRLQSWFAHSGWFAQYVTLSIPFVMVFLTSSKSFFTRVSIILLILLLGEFVLVLTYQRGGWLSYPLTLVFVWIAIYVVRCLEKDKLDVFLALKRSLLKVLISLPLTLIATFLILTWINRSHPDNSLSQYVERFKGIQQTSDRTDFIVAGYLIGYQHPWIGAGSDSFGYEFEREFEDPAGNYYQKFNLPLHGTAHNVYAQTFSGKGIFGLASLLGVLLALLFNLKLVVAKNQLLIGERVLILICATFAIAFLIYGNVQEIFYIHSLQILFFMVVAIASSQLPLGSHEINHRSIHKVCWSVLLLLLLHMTWEYVFPKKVDRFDRVKNNIGCYRSESDAQGGVFKWCRRVAYQQLLLQNKQYLDLTISAPSQLTKPLDIQISSDYFLTQEININPGTTRNIQIKLETEIDLQSIPVKFISNSHFVPAKLIPASKDYRPLSFQITGSAAFSPMPLNS